MLAELAGANAAFQVIKTAVQNGKEIASAGKAISNFVSAKEDLERKATKKGGGSDLESVAFGPLGHPDEMGQTLSELVDEVAAAPGYLALFEAAFDDGLTLPNLVRALAQFQRSLVSTDAPYDRYMAGDESALGAAALAGMGLVERHCGDCHAAPFFTDFSFANNGLDSTYSMEQTRLAWGRGRVTGNDEDIGAYKVPTLRNIMVTAPYMHDGRFTTLEEVINLLSMSEFQFAGLLRRESLLVTKFYVCRI